MIGVAGLLSAWVCLFTQPTEFLIDTEILADDRPLRCYATFFFPASGRGCSSLQAAASLGTFLSRLHRKAPGCWQTCRPTLFWTFYLTSDVENMPWAVSNMQHNISHRAKLASEEYRFEAQRPYRHGEIQISGLYWLWGFIHSFQLLKSQGAKKLSCINQWP